MRDMRVRYSPNAISDLLDIASFVSEQNPIAADKIGVAIQDTVLLLSKFPYKSRRTNQRGTRALPLSQYPYIIFFRIRRDELEILHVLHGARRHPGFQDEPQEFAAEGV